MTLDDPYLRRLDSLARLYNSQITAHVGYEISLTVGLLVLLSGFSSIAVQLRCGIAGTIGGMLDKHVPCWIVVIGVLVLDVVCLVLYFSLPRPSLMFRHLLGRTLYYISMSQIVSEHMGLKSREGDADFEALRKRALLRERKDENGKTKIGMEGGIEKAVMSLLEARLFVSRCKEIRNMQSRLERLAEKVKSGTEMKKKDLGEFLEKVFDVTGEERKAIIRDETGTNWYSKGIIFPTWLGYRENTLLFLAHRVPSSEERETCLKYVFDC